MTSAAVLHDQPPAFAAELDALINSTVGSQTVVGTSVLVAVGGRPVYARFAGWADRERERPVTERTLFRLASMTKPIVSAAILELVAGGRLHLHASVASYLPWFRPRFRGSECPITIFQLLTHTGGLAYGFGEPFRDHPYIAAGVSDGIDLPVGTLRENLERLAGVELYAVPGREWRYSLAADVLGAVLEAVCATPLREAIAQTVTGPLGMNRTAFNPVEPAELVTAYADAGTPGDRAKRMPELCLYDREDGSRISYAPSRAFDTAAYQSGGVGLTGDASDYLRFLEAVRSGRFPSGQAGEMTRDQIQDLPINRPDTGFGLGFSVLRKDAPDGRSAGTWGWGGVYGTNFWVDPKRNVAAIVLTNTALEGMSGRFPARIAEIVCAGTGRTPTAASRNEHQGRNNQ
jgi:CubicO group peptidase (beta-lactamase class C family)